MLFKSKCLRHYICVFFLVVTSCAALSAQKSLEDILWTSQSFDDIVSTAESYFNKKHPGTSLRSLSAGENRDSEYVKFMRWKSFWKHSLNEDGTLGDISAFHRNQKSQSQFRTAKSPFISVSWTNLSYEDYITSQIGLGRTTSMAFHPTNANIFYVGAAIGGVWRTTDGGSSYEPLGDDLPFMAVSSVILDQEFPSILYIAISDHVIYGPPGIGIYKSVDGGNTWQKTSLSFDLKDNIRIYWIEPDPNNSAIMYVATSAGLYKTTNRFISVVKLNEKSTFDVKVNTGNSNYVYQGGFDGTFSRSTDGGLSFTEINDFGGSPVYIATTPLNANQIFVRHYITLYKSFNGGVSFSSQSNLPESNLVMAFSPSDANTLLLGNFSCHRSDNGGSTVYQTSDWKGINGLPMIHVDQRNMFTNPLEPDAVYYCNDGGVYRYRISTNSFDNLCNGLEITQFYDIAVAQSDDQVIGGGSQDNGNVFRNTSGVWSEYAPTGDGMNQEIDPTDANIRYWAYQNGYINRWESGTNTEISPSNLGGTGAWETPYRLDPTNPNRIIAGYEKVYESLDQGNSWTSISPFLRYELQEIAISKSNPNRIYAAKNNELFVKNTLDNSWVTRNLPGDMISDIEIDPLNMDMIYVTVPGFIHGKKVFLSTDAGMTWSNISGSLPNVSTGAIEIYESVPGGLFVGTDAGVYYKDNLLPDWQQYGALPHTRVEDIEIQYSSSLIRIGTHGRGVLEAPIIIENCPLGAADYDNDGICDSYDPCNNLDNSLIGTACDDGDPNTIGEYYTSDCECGNGIPNLNYCAASSSPGTGGDWIKRVTINTIDNKSLYENYGNFKEISTTLAAGSTYDLTIQLSESFELDKVYAWVDFDRDGVFEGSELVNMSDLDPNHISKGVVNIPDGVGLSPTVMRVRSIYGNPNTPDPCGAYFGEVEDYTIRFTHCESAGTFGTGSDWINNVKLGTIDNTSTKSNYSDFTNLSTDLARSNSYSISVALNYAFPLDTVLVWIDYNQNGVFEANEQLLMSTLTSGFNGTAVGGFIVPDNALPGKTIMRVKSYYVTSNEFDACGFNTAGEVEDYEINITYCAAEALTGTGDDYINRVSVQDIDHISGKSSYSDFTNISTDLARGNQYPIEVTLPYAFDLDSVFVWIDYNRNNLFEPSEHIVMSQLQVGPESSATGVIQVPADAVQGPTVMRVRSVYNNVHFADPCLDEYGEVEDYTINLTYCAGEGALGTGADFISQVVFNSLDKVSSQSQYSDFKENTTILYRKNTYELNVTINYAFDLDDVLTWIDFNQDGVFSPDEQLNTSALGIGASQISSSTFTVGEDIPLGETVMRTRVIYSNDNPIDPCGSYYGEVEDYTIIFADNAIDAKCESNVILGNEVGNLANGTYTTSDFLNSKSRIAADSTVHFKAGQAIFLNPGFDSKLGTIFSATIETCTTSNN